MSLHMYNLDLDGHYTANTCLRVDSPGTAKYTQSLGENFHKTPILFSVEGLLW